MQRVRISKDVKLRYATPDGMPLYLDIVRPEHASSAPVILAVFGGGWCSGSRESVGAAAQRLARAGYVVCSIDYRLAPAHPYPAACDDLRAAVRWVTYHITEYGGNAARLGAYGVSAGGHLVACLATEPESPLACAVSWGGPIDLREQPVTHAYRAFPLAFMGACRHEMPELYAQASPICRLSPATPPLLLIHGSEDEVVPLAQPQRMAQRAQEVSADVSVLILEGIGHAPEDPRLPVMATAWNAITDFYATHLAPMGDEPDGNRTRQLTSRLAPTR